MADNDDDDSFGEFTFAPIQPPVNPPSHLPITTTAADADWGDFTYFQNNPTNHAVNYPSTSPSPSQPQPKWEKIQGALPLSFFGDEEETEKSDVNQSNYNPTNGGFVFDNNRKKSDVKLGINDLIADLYGPNQLQQQQSVKVIDDGNGLDFSALTSTVSNDQVSKSDSLGFGGNQESDDEGGWEFIDAFSDSKVAQNAKDHKELSETTVSSSGPQGGSNGPIDLFAAPNNGFFVESKKVTNFENGFSEELKVDTKGTSNELSSNPLGGNDDFDDTFGEFEAAFVEPSSVKKELFEERFDPLGSHDKSHGSVDLFSFSYEAPSGSHMENNGFDFSQISQPLVVENGFATVTFSQTEWKETKDDSDSKPPDIGDDDDESFGNFETTFQESRSTPEGFEASKMNYKEPVPLSIFGIEEDPEADNSLNLENDLFKSSTQAKHTRNLSSNLSINDILSDLYSQAQAIRSDGNKDLLHSHDNANANDNDDDDFNDDSWEFKDASAQSGNQNLSVEKKLNSCMNLYSNLKDDLCVVARRHFYSLKKAQSTATLAGEEMKVAALNKEIQVALETIHQKDISTEMHLDDYSESVISLQKYIETFQEPDFQVLDSEYNLSRKLLLAESDLSTAVDLINHFTTALKTLTLAPNGEPADYVSLWFKVISVCSQELNHATWIWKQALEKNVHNEIFSEKEGMKMVTWNEDKYFVTLANLWANLISPDPPKLSIHVG